MNAATAERFAKAAEALLGRPFRHRGANEAGFDCRGYVFVAAAAIGVSMEPFADYERQPDPEVVLAETVRRCDRAEWEERLLPGRVLLLRQSDGGGPKHFAITLGEVLGDGWAVHATETGTKRARIRDEFVHSVWRVRGIDYQPES